MVIIFYIAFIFLLWKSSKHEHINSTPIDVIKYLENIDDLHTTAQKYRAIEDMLINLETATKSTLTNVTIDVPAIHEGAGVKYDFLCSGGETTQQLIAIAERERAALLQELYTKTNDLYKMQSTAASLDKYHSPESGYQFKSADCYKQSESRARRSESK